MTSVSRLLGVVLLVASSLAVPAPAAAGNATGKDLQLPEGPFGLTIAGSVSDTHGHPLGGAEAGICPATDDCFAAEATSAADGSFVIDNLTAGAYFLRVDPPEAGNFRKTWYTGAPGGSTDPSDAVAIEIADPVTGIDVELPDALRITGHVKSPEGDPVEGVWVVSGGSSIPSAADGLFQIVGLAPGDYELQVMGPDGGEYPNGYVVDGAEQQEGPGSTYSLVDADITDADITLYRGRTISGHLAGASGKSVAVSAIDADVRFEALVNGSGNFTVTGLWPGSYHLLFSVPESSDFLDSQFPYGIYDGDGQPLADQNAPGVAIDVSAGNASGIDAVLPVHHTVSGTVSDVGGPVAGAGVLLCDPDNGCARVTSAGDGTFAALNIPDGSYKIQAGAGHHVVVGFANGRSNPDPFATAPVKVHGASVSGIHIVLPRGNSIGGKVTGTGGLPLAGVDMSGSPLSGGIWEFGPGPASTGGDGLFSVGGLVDGDYRLAASPAEDTSYRGGYWSTSGYTSDSSAATVIHLADVSAPNVSAPTLAFKPDGRLGSSTVPVRVRWTSSDAGSNVETDRLQQQKNGGGWSTVATPVGTLVDRSLAASTTTTYRFRTQAVDYAGNASGFQAGGEFRVLRREQSTGAITWKGSWSTSSDGSASGGSYRWTKASGASARFTFTGRAIGWVAPIGPAYGKAKVYVDGDYLATVDLHASTASSRRIVFTKAWSSSHAHSIRVVGQATSGHAKVAVDAFVVLR